MRLLFTCLSFFVGLHFAAAQKDAAIITAMRNKPTILTSASEIEINKSVAQASGILLHGEDKDVEKQFKHFMETKQSIDLKKHKGLLQKTGLKIEQMHNDTVTLLADFKKQKTGTLLALGASSGGNYLDATSHPQAFKYMDSLLTLFGKDFYQWAYAEVLNDERKSLEKMERELERQRKEQSSLNNSLSSTMSKIKSDEVEADKARNAVKAADGELETLETLKNNQKKQLDEVETEMNTIEQKKAPLEATVIAKQNSGDVGSKEYKKQNKELEKLKKELAKQQKQKDKYSSVLSKTDDKLVKQRSLRNKAESKQRDYETHIISLKNEEDKLKGNIRDTEKEIDRLQADIKDKSSLISDLEASGAALGLQL
jgi:hypothetical protein